MSWIESAVNDAQQGPCESEQLKKTVEAKVDQMSGQTHHLKEEGKWKK